MKERNISIDILKFLAVLLITNSHMELLYGKYCILATGGTIGNALFFFCSGFTLFMKPITSIKDFPNWYKRRINRIYPTVLAIAIIKCSLFDINLNIIDIILHGGGWFVSCIMTYYVFIYLIGLYLREKVSLIIIIVSLASCLWFFSVERTFPFDIYYYKDSGYLDWLIYFNFMLLGAKIGSLNIEDNGKSAKKLIFSLLGIIVFYTIYVSGVKIEKLEFIEILSFIPLLLAVYYLYQWGNRNMAKKIYTNKAGYFVIRFVGGLCLEIYLIQNCIFTDNLNSLFPLNLLIIFCAIVIMAFITRILARLISQTFKENPYDWKKIINIY